MQSGVCERSGSTGELVRVSRAGLRGQSWTTTTCQSPTTRHVEEVFSNLRQKFTLPEDARPLNEQTNVLI